MKKFGIHILLFLFLPILLVFVLFNTRSSLFLNNAAPVYHLLSKAGNIQLETHTLLLGDSVCREFFEEERNEKVYCLCENQSYEVPGNYLLLKTLLDNGSRFKRLILMINPRTLTSSLNQKYTYNYFIKPFRNQLADLDANEKKYIQDNFPAQDILKYRFSNFEIAKAYDIYQNSYQDSLRISEVNRNYIRKIDSTCKSNNIDFKLLCPPLPASSKKYLKNFDQDSRIQFNSYIGSVIFYDSLLSKDGLHHINSNKFVTENKTKLDSLLNY